MSVDRTEGRRTNHRAFRPTLDGGLESRFLLSKLPGQFFLNHPQPGVAYVHKQPPLLSGTHALPFPIATFPRGHAVKVEVAHGGQSAIVATPDGSHFKISLTQFVPTPSTSTTGVAALPAQPPIQEQVPGAGVVQPIGTIRAYQMSGGKVGLILDGTTNQSELDISSLPFPQRKGYAHSFAYGATRKSHLLNIGTIIVNSGVISAINGYHTAVLSGPLTIVSQPAPPPQQPEPGSTQQPVPQPVDRISFNALLPGASIKIGGDLNTLDVLNGVQLISGNIIDIGQDLNLINVGGNLDLSGGGSIVVHRFLGTTPQPPKGTATGSNFLSLNQSLVGTGTSTIVPSLAGYIQGNILLGTKGTFTVQGAAGIVESTPITTTSASAPNVVLVNGMVTASSPSQIAIPNIVPSNTFSNDANFIARDGFIINNVPVSFIPLTARLISGTTTATGATANFTGTATPGATVTYTDSNSTIPPKTTMANNSGVYPITVPLAFGMNVFTVTSTDAFGRIVAIQTPTVTPLTSKLVSPTPTTSLQAAFTGTATPGATVTYTSLTNGGVTVQLADTTGNYSITVPLAVVGPNPFTVTSSDGFTTTAQTVTRTT